MAKLLYVAAILLSLSMVFAGDAAADADTSDAESSSTEGKAGEAIKTLLQEKITQKFKEAANEVKGVLVKQLGDSLKSAHDVFKARDKNKVTAAVAAKATGGKADDDDDVAGGLCRDSVHEAYGVPPPRSSNNHMCINKKFASRCKCHACKNCKTTTRHTGAAAIHQNKANRHRKNSGPAGGMPPTEAKGGAPIPVEGKGQGPIEGKGPGPIEGKGVPFSEAKGPGPMPPPPPLDNCAPQQPCGPPPMDMQCCGQQYPMMPPPPPPMAPMGCAPGPCAQTCGPSCQPQQCCPGKRAKIMSHKKAKKDD